MSQPYYLRIRAGGFRASDFVKYATGVGGTTLCRDEDIEEGCTVVFNTGVVKYYQDSNVNTTYWIIEVYGNIHGTLNILQDFIKDVWNADIEPLNNCNCE